MSGVVKGAGSAHTGRQLKPDPNGGLAFDLGAALERLMRSNAEKAEREGARVERMADARMAHYLRRGK